MRIACWSKEALQNEVRLTYEEHIGRLDEWIGNLTKQAADLLNPETAIAAISDGITSPNRILHGLQAGARQLIATAMKLSQMRLQAALLLARQTFWQEIPPQTPCAREVEKTPKKAVSAADLFGVKSSTEKSCERMFGDPSRVAVEKITPVRAAQSESQDPLSALLAQDAEEVFASLGLGRRKGRKAR